MTTSLNAAAMLAPAHWFFELSRTVLAEKKVQVSRPNNVRNWQRDSLERLLRSRFKILQRRTAAMLARWQPIGFRARVSRTRTCREEGSGRHVRTTSGTGRGTAWNDSGAAGLLRLSCFHLLLHPLVRRQSPHDSSNPCDLKCRVWQFSLITPWRCAPPDGHPSSRNVSCRRFARRLSANSEKARENVASLGSRPAPLQPHSRHSLPSRTLASISTVTLPRRDGNPWVIADRLPGTHVTDPQRRPALRFMFSPIAPSPSPRHPTPRTPCLGLNALDRRKRLLGLWLRFRPSPYPVEMATLG